MSTLPAAAHPGWLRPALLGGAVFDWVLGGVSVCFPDLLLHVLWPEATADGASLLRRTGIIWLVFALAQTAAWRRPTPERLRAVVLLRLMDVPADLVWYWSATGLSAFGSWTIGGAPLANLTLGWLFWQAARSAGQPE